MTFPPEAPREYVSSPCTLGPAPWLMYVPMLTLGYCVRANCATRDAGSPSSRGLNARPWGFQARFSRREKPARRLKVVLGLMILVQSSVRVRPRRPRGRIVLVSAGLPSG